MTSLVSREALRQSRVWGKHSLLSGKILSRLFLTLLFPGNVMRLPVSVVCDEYQKAKARKRHLSYTPRPRLVRDALSANGLSSTLSTSVEVMHNRDPLVDAV